jgi:hypothetical protein
MKISRMVKGKYGCAFSVLIVWYVHRLLSGITKLSIKYLAEIEEQQKPYITYAENNQFSHNSRCKFFECGS